MSYRTFFSFYASWLWLAFFFVLVILIITLSNVCNGLNRVFVIKFMLLCISLLVGVCSRLSLEVLLCRAAIFGAVLWLIVHSYMRATPTTLHCCCFCIFYIYFYTTIYNLSQTFVQKYFSAHEYIVITLLYMYLFPLLIWLCGSV